MKRMMCIALSAAMLLCGCRSGAPTGGETQRPTEQMTEQATEETLAFAELETTGTTLPVIQQGTDAGIIPEKTGRVRVAYTGNASSVRYVTRVEELPDNEALNGYDAAYFEDHALVLVVETVSSGSAQVDIASIEGGVVTLSHKMPGGEGTTDMATWLLWAEVEPGLDWTWSVANPALKSDALTH